ncbi:DEAD/DEAH box helicase [Lysinibacillus sp. NPDC098008]|uniref:DEAD/DEAH box helicase n=1 Tax=Lysinibacillus sp. NPDC098008 TaxID=3364146 RepID=UPI0037FB72FE
MKTQFVSMKELQNGKITTQLATRWIKRKQHLLINSQTGSGKTTSLMNAVLNLADPNTSEFYIFTAPTINLCEQVFKDHPNGTLLLTGKVKNKTELIEQHINQGYRVFICTYDQATNLISSLKSFDKETRYNLIIDEYHRLITDYNEDFRKQTMKQLFKVQKKAKSLIGLSGTPQLVLVDDFNYVIEVERTNKKLFEEFAFISFSKELSFKECLLEYIDKRVSEGYKILLYLQSVRINEQIVAKLRENGISAINIDSTSTKENEGYKSIINNSFLPENYDVILTTSLLAEGISINKRENEKVEVVVLAHQYSKFFNPFVIEQISHRIRQPYDRFSIFSENPDDFNKPDIKPNLRLYNYKKAFEEQKQSALKSKYNLTNTNGYKKITNDIIAQCEKNAYLEVNEDIINIDELEILYTIHRQLELHYQKNRHAFLAALKKQFPLNSLLVENFELTTSQNDDLNDEKEIHKEALCKRFRLEDFNALRKESRRINLQLKKLNLTSKERKMIKALCPYTPTYELLIEIVQKSTPTSVNQLVAALNGFLEINLLKKLKKENFTTKYIKLIEDVIDGKYYSSKDLKSLLEDAYKFAVINIDNAVLKANEMRRIYFYKHEIRTNSKRTFTLKLHNLSTLATQFDLNELQITVLVQSAMIHNNSSYKKEIHELLLASKII